jgi:AcrR family transcriptional regulator
MNVTNLREPRSAPARSRANTRRRLVDAGTDLFARRGLHATTTVDVARAAGVAAGTFYLHFSDKHALFREIILDAFGQLRERLARASARAGDDPVARLRARVEELLDFAEENRSLVRVLFGRDHEAADLSEEVFADTVPGIEAGLRRRLGGRASEKIDPAVAAQGLAAMWTRVVAWWLEDPERAPRAHVAQTLVELHPFSRR